MWNDLCVPDDAHPEHRVNCVPNGGHLCTIDQGLSKWHFGDTVHVHHHSGRQSGPMLLGFVWRVVSEQDVGRLHSNSRTPEKQRVEHDIPELHEFGE
jgi:hypothetical protein